MFILPNKIFDQTQYERLIKKFHHVNGTDYGTEKKINNDQKSFDKTKPIYQNRTIIKEQIILHISCSECKLDDVTEDPIFEEISIQIVYPKCKMNHDENSYASFVKHLKNTK